MSPARTRGSITLELVIAFAVLSLVLASVILLTGSSDALAFESQSAERSIAEQLLHDTASTTDLSALTSLASTSIRDRIAYAATLTVTSLTPCLVHLSGITTSTGGVGDGVSFETLRSDTGLMTALGSDCEYEAATSSWKGIVELPILALSGTSIDVLNDYAYVGLLTPPYFAIVHAGQRLSFANAFTLLAMPNAVDAAMLHGKPYVFAAMASSSNQFMVINVYDPRNPTIAASLSLANVNPLGSDPAAYHVAYNDGIAYVVTRFISGPQPELHLIDVHDPAHPFETGTGNLETTVRGMALRTRLVSGNTRIYLYAATTHDARELAVYDVTNPAHVSLVYSVDLPGSQDGDSIAVEGNQLYLGRASNTTGPELYVFDIHDPTKAPVLLGTAEISSKDITGIIPIGNVLFVSATNDGAGNRQMELWDASDAAHLTQVSSQRIPGLVLGGIEYARGTAYALDASALHTYVGE